VRKLFTIVPLFSGHFGSTRYSMDACTAAFLSAITVVPLVKSNLSDFAITVVAFLAAFIN